jgi:hypothetical protein
MQIDRQSFDTWAAEKTVEFAATTVAGHRPHVRERLIFHVIVAGSFKVTKGSKTLYAGTSFDEAAGHFNAGANA